ncbi:hypothetical protein D3C87_186040 [compost metagenome]
MTHPEYFQSRPKGTETELKQLAKDSIQFFFDEYDLDESQDLLWQLVKQSFSSTSSTLSAQERENLMSFYENLHQMILFASILHNGRVSQQVWSV